MKKSKNNRRTFTVCGRTFTVTLNNRDGIHDINPRIHEVFNTYKGMQWPLVAERVEDLTRIILEEFSEQE